jgi:hypothetical protein
MPALPHSWAVDGGFIDADRVPPDGKVSFGCCLDTAHLVRLVYYS